jgi:ribonuclease Z
MSFTVTILGSGAAAPTAARGLSATSVVIQNTGCLVDCGEGTQMQMRRFRIKHKKLKHIFITHLHGDHFFGLIGLLFSLHLNNRKDELHIYGFKELMVVLDYQINLSISKLNFPIVFHELIPETSALITDEKHFTVTAVPLIHRVPACGFIFREKVKPRRISKDFLEKEQPTIEQIKAIARGEGFTGITGVHYSNQEISTESPLKSFAFITDTAYNEELLPFLKYVDLLYHEATFMKEFTELAAEKGHSTVEQAALIACKAEAKKLILGHISARYPDMDILLHEATSLFQNTVVAYDGMVIEVK